MKRSTWISAALLFGVLGHGLTQASTLSSRVAGYPAPEYSIPMREMSDSNERGAALFRDMPGATLVVIKLDKPLAESQPIEIVTGGCGGTDVHYRLDPLKLGETVSSLKRVTVSTLRRGNYFVIVRRSDIDSRVVSCGKLAAGG